MIQLGDNVCFGERLGAFGKIPHKVTGIEQRDDGLYIKTDYGTDYAPADMFEECQIVLVNMTDVGIDFNEELCNLAKDFPELRKVNKMKMLRLCKHFFDLGVNSKATELL